MREAALSALRAETEAIADRRGVDVSWSTISEQRATRCTPALVARVAEAVRATGLEVRELPSGAGHDAVTMARVADVAMLFVRCAGRHQPPPRRVRRSGPTWRWRSRPPMRFVEGFAG